MLTRSFRLAAVLSAGLWAVPARAADPGPAVLATDQKEYSGEEPVYFFAPAGGFACGRETILRLKCVECRQGAVDCPCREEKVKAPCRLHSKSGTTEIWEFAQRLKPGHYRLRVKDRPETPEFFVRSWPGLPPMELEADTDQQIYREGEELVVSLRNGSDHPVLALEGCFSTPVRFSISALGGGSRASHPCVAGVPAEPRVAAVIDAHRKLDIRLRVPASPNMQLVPYVEFKRAATAWEYQERFGTLRPEGFRGTAEALPVCVLPQS